MPPAPQQGNQDNSSGLLWIIAALFVTIGVIWFIFKAEIVSFYLSIKLYELNFISFLNAYFSRLLGFGGYSFDQLEQALLYARANPLSTPIASLDVMGTAVGVWLRIPFLIVLLILGFVVYLSNTTRSFTRAYNMIELAKLEQTNWPQVTPIMNLDLIKVDIDTGPWAMAMTPLQFSKKNRLLEEVMMQRQEGMSHKEWNKIGVVLKKGEANKVFALQLGPLWKDINQLPPYTQALFAVFAARINADSKPAIQLLNQLSASSNQKLDFSGVKELLKKHLNTKPVQKIIQSHAYVFTVMASMLAGAREDGVQASADFLWLKPVDRKLWYTLNTVGRQTPFIEVAGIFAHWIAEKEAGRRLLVPMISEATNALEIALKEVIYKRDEE